MITSSELDGRSSGILSNFGPLLGWELKPDKHLCPLSAGGSRSAKNWGVVFEDINMVHVYLAGRNSGGIIVIVTLQLLCIALA